jgi:uncharacterized membrane protein
VNVAASPRVDTPPGADQTATTPKRPGRGFAIAVAAWFLLASFTPSLVPRSWLVQGVTSGLAAAYGYALGLAAAWLARRAARAIDLRVTASPVATRRLRRTGWTLLAVVVGLVWLWSLSWQRDSARLVGLPEPGLGWAVLGLLGTVVVLALALLVARGLWALVRLGARAAGRLGLPRVVATPLTALVVAALVVGLLDVLVYRGVMDRVTASAGLLNADTPDGRHRPASALRSGSPASAEPWKTLGRNGQAFVADGPGAAEIAAATGAPATEPIRVYAGLSRGRSVEEVADAVVAELRRTGAFDRGTLALMTTTGRGWVDEWSASSIEYLTGGDSAIAAMQYSFLPSPVALVTDRRTPARAGRALLTRVEAEIARRPADRRPRLVLGGESLGAYGGQAAFDDAADMLDRVDGAVWVGTPGFTPVWRGLTDRRQGGSPEIAPVVDSGSHVRFATRPGELGADVYGRRFGPWEFPRVVYAQHASDPIPRWTTSLLVEEPDWTREPPGADVIGVRWSSFVMFWQLTTDLATANSTPTGHGHRYQEELIPAWAAVLGAPPQLDLDRIEQSIRTHYRPV